MPVFISYSHQDRAFVERLAVQLVRQGNARVWIDQWELRVGDSILDKIQTAITRASALLVVLSRASVASEWCKRELSAGLMRELDERRVIVLPVLLEDCDIPAFLREKRYADFRTDYDGGLRDTLMALAAITSDTQGRIETPEYHTDWGVSWGTLDDGTYALQFTFLDHSERVPYSAVTDIRIACNNTLSAHVLKSEADAVGWFARLIIVASLRDAAEAEAVGTFLLTDSQPQTKNLHFHDPRNDYGFDAHISSRRLGTDTGMNTRLDWRGHINNLFADLTKDVSEADRQRLRRTRSTSPSTGPES